ncbi:glucose-1-phosphate adenylyltransferase small subunit, chloroplastic/amyloplastic [Tanacetum coccineum]
MDPVIRCTTLPSHLRSLKGLLFYFSQRSIRNCKIHHSVVGLRSCIAEGAVIEDSLLMGADYYETFSCERDADTVLLIAAKGRVPIGIGKNTHIKREIIDMNARIRRTISKRNRRVLHKKRNRDGHQRRVDSFWQHNIDDAEILIDISEDSTVRYIIISCDGTMHLVSEEEACRDVKYENHTIWIQVVAKKSYGDKPQGAPPTPLYLSSLLLPAAPPPRRVNSATATLGHERYYIDSFFLNLTRLPMGEVIGGGGQAGCFAVLTGSCVLVAWALLLGYCSLLFLLRLSVVQAGLLSSVLCM